MKFEPICQGWKGTPSHPCKNEPEEDTQLCISCRKDIEWLHEPLTPEEEESVNLVCKKRNED